MSIMLFNKKEIKIMKEFSDDYDKRIYGRELAKKLKMNQKTVSNILIKLEKKNILKYSFEGKNKYYSLNKFNLYLVEIIKIIEISKKIEFLEKHKETKSLFDKIQEKSSGVLLIFGSYAKGEETKKSDLDICVIGKIEDLSSLEKIYSIKINCIRYNKLNFMKKDTLSKEIIKNHVILKGLEEFVEILLKWLV